MSTADNLLLLYRNLVDDATVTASSAVTGAEASFIQTMEPGEPWRATGKVSEYVDIDFGSSIDATHGALVAFNSSTKGTLQCICSDDPTFDPDNDVYNSGEVDAWDPISGFGFDGFGLSLGGYPILNAFNDYRALKLFDFGGLKTFRYTRYRIKDPDNTLITGCAIGRGFVGFGFQPEFNFDFDWSNQWVDPSSVVVTEQTARIKKARKYRQAQLSLSNLTEGEALTAMDDIKRTIGGSRDIIAVLFPTAGAPKRYRTSIYGIPVDRQGVTNPYFDVYKTSLFIRELAA